MQPKRSFADNSQTAGWNDEDTHSFAQQNGAYTGCNVECETWLQNEMTCRTNKWMRWKSAVPSDLLRRAAHGLRNSTLSSSWIKWARSEILQLIMHLEMMVFDLQRPGWNVLSCINWLMATGSSQMRISDLYCLRVLKLLCKCFGTEIKIAREWNDCTSHNNLCDGITVEMARGLLGIIFEIGN